MLILRQAVYANPSSTKKKWNTRWSANIDILKTALLIVKLICQLLGPHWSVVLDGVDCYNQCENFSFQCDEIHATIGRCDTSFKKRFFPENDLTKESTGSTGCQGRGYFRVL